MPHACGAVIRAMRLSNIGAQRGVGCNEGEPFSRPFRRGARHPATRQRAAARPSAGSHDEKALASSAKNLELVRKFAEQYARLTDTRFCVDKSVTAVVLHGLAVHKSKLGAPLCPCRHYEDPSAEASEGFWNCPCVPMRERRDCHCMLFLEPNSTFAGNDAQISAEEVDEVAQ